MGCLIYINLIPYYQGEQRDVITLTFKMGNGNFRIIFSFPTPTAPTFYLISDRKLIFDSSSWRDESQLKNTCYYSRGSKLCSQHHIGYLTRAINNSSSRESTAICLPLKLLLPVPADTICPQTHININGKKKKIDSNLPKLYEKIYLHWEI